MMIRVTRSLVSSRILFVAAALVMTSQATSAEEPAKSSAKLVDTSGPEWKSLGKDDFTNVNCHEDTWKWNGGEVHCTGEPVGVIRSVKPYTNFELALEWRHLKPAGNSGVFVWGVESSMKTLKPGGLPHGIEVQVLDTGYEESYKKSTGKDGDWFTCHGDVFPVGVKMKPFPPTSPNGQRSFPKKDLSKSSPEWNHYYIRANKGEIRLSVNGEEVSGGENCEPSTGFLCLESEGSPVKFKNLRIRELP